MKPSDARLTMETISDAQLVAACLGGDRNAFGRIVERYQRLLCSLAYSATGRLSESEDVAQEAFLTAWQDLGKLREPAKLRPWLCGILRYKVSRLRRRQGREPIDHSAALEDAGELPAHDEPTPHNAMKREEQELLWHALEQVPERYREPLVLYYREHRSVEHVAVELDLTEAAVKQRLSRGRKMLQERVLAFVEGALERTTPGPVFTAGVAAAIATLAPPAKAAAVGTAGAAATKAGMTVKTTVLLAWIASLSGLVSTFFALRAGLDQSRTAKERRATVVMVVMIFIAFAGLVGVMFGLRAAALVWPETQGLLTVLSQGVVVAFAIGWPWHFASQLRASARLRAAERLRLPEAFADPRDHAGSKSGEYCSRLTFLGLPLIHIRFSAPELDSKPLVAWIAGGDRAIGILFAWGAFSVGFISVGAVSVGLFSLGAVSLGLISLGSIALGFIALGAMSIGYHAFGSLTAMAWEGAQAAGFAIARWFAEGPIAYAAHANDAVARAHFTSPHADFFVFLFLITVSFLTIVPVALYAIAVRKRMRRN